MPATFKIKHSIVPVGFEPGEVRGASEFPPGTDFQRLIDSGAIRPTELSEFQGDPKHAELMDTVEDLTEKLSKHQANSDKEKEKLEAELKAARVAEDKSRKEVQAASSKAAVTIADLERQLAESKAKHEPKPAEPEAEPHAEAHHASKKGK